MIEQAFEVATEFKFDVGEAIFNTDALRGSVEDLSKSASGALQSLNYLAGGLVAHLGFGSGGLLSVMTRAVQLSEEFNSGSMGFVNTISSNMNVLTGHVDTFNDKLESSAMIMNKIGSEADKLGLSGAQMAQIVQLYAGPLSQRKKLGTDFSGGISLARNTMIGAEAMGIHPAVLSEAIARALSPGQTLGGKPFERLVNTQAFRGAGIMHPNQLSNMQQDKKMDLLIKAMSELGNNAGYLDARLNSLAVRFNILKAQVEAILKPIGDAIKGPMMMIFKSMTDFLTKNGPAIGKNIAAFIQDIFKDPKALLINLLQIKEAGKDFGTAIHIAGFFITLKWIKGILEWLGVTFNGGMIRAFFGYLVDGLMWLKNLIPWGLIFRQIFSMIGTVLIEFLPILVAAFLILQGISRAKAQAKVSDVEDVGKMTPRITSAVLVWKDFLVKLWSPFQTIIDTIADLVTPLFKTSNYLAIFLDITEYLVPALETLGNIFLFIGSCVSGVIEVIKEELTWLINLPNQFMDAVTSSDPATMLKHLFDGDTEGAFGRGQDSFLKRMEDRRAADSIASHVYNTTNNVTARFDMREQMEPDRIAFAVTTHLKNLTNNQTQSRGRSIHAGLTKTGSVAL